MECDQVRLFISFLINFTTPESSSHQCLVLPRSSSKDFLIVVFYSAASFSSLSFFNRYQNGSAYSRSSTSLNSSFSLHFSCLLYSIYLLSETSLGLQRVQSPKTPIFMTRQQGRVKSDGSLDGLEVNLPKSETWSMLQPEASPILPHSKNIHTNTMSTI